MFAFFEPFDTMDVFRYFKIVQIFRFYFVIVNYADCKTVLMAFLKRAKHFTDTHLVIRAYEPKQFNQ